MTSYSQVFIRFSSSGFCPACAGGAGTTATGLLAACPTTVIFFFGDQVLHNKLSVTCAATPFMGAPLARFILQPIKHICCSCSISLELARENYSIKLWWCCAAVLGPGLFPRRC